MSVTLDKDRKVLGGFAAANNAKSKIKPNDSFNGLKMYGMFQNCKAFNSDLSSWNMSKVEDTDYMFSNATAMKASHKPKGV